MSLTTELNNPASPISQWFAAKYHQGIGNIVKRHNQVMSRSSILSPIDGTDFPLVGNAAAYGWRKFVAAKQGNTQWVGDTLAGAAAKEARLEQLATLCANQSKSTEEEALKMLILGCQLIP